MSNERIEFNVYALIARITEHITSLAERISRLEQESTAKDKLIERLQKENESLMRENIDMRQNPNHWRL
jgi:hypothetical protein